MVIPRFKEFTVQAIWTWLEDESEHPANLPDFSQTQRLERDYLTSIISTSHPEATQPIANEAREVRFIGQSSDQDELVKIMHKLIKK